MIETGNITNQIITNIGINSGAVASVQGTGDNGNLGNFISLIIQNIRGNLQTPAQNKPINNLNNNQNLKVEIVNQIQNSEKLQKELQNLLNISPNELENLLEKFVNSPNILPSNSEGNIQIADIVNFLQQLSDNNKTKEIASNLDVTQQNNTKAGLALQAQLMGQNIQNDGILTELTKNNTQKAINANLSGERNQVKNNLNPTPAPNSNLNSNLVENKLVNNINTNTNNNTNINNNINTNTNTNTNNVTAENSKILSFNNDDILKSFVSQNTEKQSKNTNNGDLNNFNITTKNNKNVVEQNQSMLLNSQNKNSNNANNSTFKITADNNVNLTNFTDSSPTSKLQAFTDSLNLQNINANNSDAALDMQLGKPITTSNFASYATAKAGQTFQTQATQQIYMNIQKNAMAKIEQMTLQLEPAKLGKIEINLRFSKDGAMKAHLVLEKRETMGMLQRDANALQEALKEAGIELEDNSLSFDMASGQEHFEKTKEQQQKTGSEFSLEMLLNNNDTAQITTNGTLLATNNINHIGNDRVNILI